MHTPLRDTFYIKRTALLLVAATDIPNLFDPIISQYRMTCDFFDLKDIGIIAVGGVKYAEDIKGNDALDQTYALGKSIV